MLWTALVATAALAVQAEAQPAPEEEVLDYGFVEFSKDPTAFGNHAIKVYAVMKEKNRLFYIDELSATGLRTLTVKAPIGEQKFVVIVTPTSSPGAAEETRRRRPNVTLDVEPGMTTPVKIGGFTDFRRGPAQGDITGTRFVGVSDDPEASQFRTRITVGDPEKRGN